MNFPRAAAALNHSLRRRTLERDAYCVRAPLVWKAACAGEKTTAARLSGQNIGLWEATPYIHSSPGQWKMNARADGSIRDNDISSANRFFRSSNSESKKFSRLRTPCSTSIPRERRKRGCESDVIKNRLVIMINYPGRRSALIWFIMRSARTPSRCGSNNSAKQVLLSAPKVTFSLRRSTQRWESDKFKKKVSWWVLMLPLVTAGFSLVVCVILQPRKYL